MRRDVSLKKYIISNAMDLDIMEDVKTSLLSDTNNLW